MLLQLDFWRLFILKIIIAFCLMVAGAFFWEWYTEHLDKTAIRTALLTFSLVCGIFGVLLLLLFA